MIRWATVFNQAMSDSLVKKGLGSAIDNDRVASGVEGARSGRVKASSRAQSNQETQFE